MAVPSIRNVGTAVFGTTGTITPTVPTHVANDILLMWVASDANASVTPTHTTPGTWTLESSGVIASGTTRVRISLYSKRTSGSESNPSVTVTPTGSTACHHSAVIISVSGCITSGAYSEGASNNSAAGAASIALTLSTTSTDRLCFLAAMHGDNVATGASATGYTQRVSTDDATGIDGFLWVGSKSAAASGSHGATVTYTSGGTSVGIAGVAVALIPAPPPDGPVLDSGFPLTSTSNTGSNPAAIGVTTPGNNRLLVAVGTVAANSSGDLSINNTAGITWTLAGTQNSDPFVVVKIWYAWVATQIASAQNVTLTVTDGLSSSLAIHCFDEAQSTVGDFSGGTSASGTDAAATVNVTAANSYIVGGGVYHPSNVDATPKTDCSEDFEFDSSGGETHWGVHRTDPTSASGDFSLGMTLSVGGRWAAAGLEVLWQNPSGPQTITPTGIDNSAALGSPGLIARATPAGIDSSATLGVHNATQVWWKDPTTNHPDRSIKNGHAAVFDRHPSGKPDTVVAVVGGNGAGPSLIYGRVGQSGTLSHHVLTDPGGGTSYPSIFQDRANHDFHVVAQDGLGAISYWRVRATRDGSGNITGFSTQASYNLGSSQFLYHMCLIEALDGSGNRRLMILGLKDVNGSPPTDEVGHFAMVTTVAAGVTPSAASAWTNFAGTANAMTSLGVTWTLATESGVEGDGTTPSAPWEYESNCAAAQHKSSLTVYYGAACGHHGTRGAKFLVVPVTVSGTTFSVGTAVKGANPTTGGVHMVTDEVSGDVYACHHESGGHRIEITKINSSGTFSNPVSTPSVGSPSAGDENAGMAVHNGRFAILMYENLTLMGRVHDGSGWLPAISFASSDPEFYWHQGSNGFARVNGKAWILGVSAPNVTPEDVTLTALQFADLALADVVGIDASAQVGTPTTLQCASPTGIDAAASPGAPGLVTYAVPTGIDNAPGLGSHTASISSSSQTITPTGIDSSASPGTPGLVAYAVPTGVDSSASLGTPGLVAYATPTGIDASASLGATGLVAYATPTGVDSSASLGTPGLVAYAVPLGIDSAASPGSPTANVEGSGNQTITPTGIDASASLGSPGLVARVVPLGVDASASLGSPGLVARATPSGIDGSATVGAHIVYQGILPSGIDASALLGSPNLIAYVVPLGIDSSAALGNVIVIDEANLAGDFDHVVLDHDGLYGGELDTDGLYGATIDTDGLYGSEVD